MPRHERPSLSMRKCVFEPLRALAASRGESLASLIDRLAVAELAAAGVKVHDYPRPRISNPRPRRKKVKPVPMSEALETPFAGLSTIVAPKPAPKPAPRYQAQSQHVEF